MPGACGCLGAGLALPDLALVGQPSSRELALQRTLSRAPSARVRCHVGSRSQGRCACPACSPACLLRILLCDPSRLRHSSAPRQTCVMCSVLSPSPAYPARTPCFPQRRPQLDMHSLSSSTILRLPPPEPVVGCARPLAKQLPAPDRGMCLSSVALQQPWPRHCPATRTEQGARVPDTPGKPPHSSVRPPAAALALPDSPIRWPRRCSQRPPGPRVTFPPGDGRPAAAAGHAAAVRAGGAGGHGRRQLPGGYAG
jgi:hypothetical protein